MGPLTLRHFTRGADTLQGGTDTLQGGTDTLQGGTDTLKGGTDTLQGGLTLYRGDGPYAMGWVSDVMQRLENGHYTRGERTLYKGGRTLKLGVPQFLRGVEIFIHLFNFYQKYSRTFLCCLA